MRRGIAYKKGVKMELQPSIMVDKAEPSQQQSDTQTPVSTNLSQPISLEQPQTKQMSFWDDMQASAQDYIIKNIPIIGPLLGLYQNYQKASKIPSQVTTAKDQLSDWGVNIPDILGDMPILGNLPSVLENIPKGVEGIFGSLGEGGLSALIDLIMHADSNYTDKAKLEELEREKNKYVDEIIAMKKAGLNPAAMYAGGGTMPERKKDNDEDKFKDMLKLLLLISRFR